EAGAAGIVLEQFALFAEADQEGDVLLTEDLAEELVGGAALDIDQVLLAAADVDKEADGQGQVGFSGEILDGLRLAVFKNGEVVLLEIGNQGALFVADAGQNADHVDVDFEGGQLVLRQKQGARGEDCKDAHPDK